MSNTSKSQVVKSVSNYNILAVPVVTNTANQTVLVGNNAGKYGQGVGCVAVGNSAGNTGQLNYAVSVGNEAGKINQGNHCVAIGNGSGYTNQVDFAVFVLDAVQGNKRKVEVRLLLDI